MGRDVGAAPPARALRHPEIKQGLLVATVSLRASRLVIADRSRLTREAVVLLVWVHDGAREGYFEDSEFSGAPLVETFSGDTTVKIFQVLKERTRNVIL